MRRGFAITTLAIVAVGSPTIAGAEAPITSDAVTAFEAQEGKWAYFGANGGRSQVLRFDAKVHPNLSMPMIRLQCGRGHALDVEVIGMIPAQRFPQPELTVSVASAVSSRFADAEYVPTSKPSAGRVPDGMKFEGGLEKLNQTRALPWPGYPAHARLVVRYRDGLPLLAALQSGEPVMVQFEQQGRRFPPVPADLAKQFFDQCESVARAPIQPPRRYGG